MQFTDVLQKGLIKEIPLLKGLGSCLRLATSPDRVSSLPVVKRKCRQSVRCSEKRAFFQAVFVSFIREQENVWIGLTKNKFVPSNDLKMLVCLIWI
jgi:hypothetical protein